jgi:hypothetical protein
MISRDTGAPPAEDAAAGSDGPAPEETAGMIPAAPSARIAARRSGSQVPLWAAGLAATGLLIVAAQAISSRGPARTPRRLASAAPPAAPHREAPASLMGPPAPPAAKPEEAPEMPSLVVGPPAPERPARDGVQVARGPGYRGAPLPPIPGLTGIQFPPPGPAVPLAIVPRGAGTAGQDPLGEPAAARPQRSTETSDDRPLTVRVSLTESESSLHGPGAWLKVRAAASGACYVAIFHIDGARHVTILFPRRFDIAYQPNVTYNLMARSDPGETGEVVVAVASVYPLTAADALAAIQASRALVPASSHGMLGSGLWDALEDYLRGRARGEAKLKGWERHAWRVAMAAHRPPAPKPAPAEAGAGGGPAAAGDSARSQPAAPGSGGGQGGASGSTPPGTGGGTGGTGGAAPGSGGGANPEPPRAPGGE